MNRGVKQDASTNLILFNLIMDDLIKKTLNINLGFKLNLI